MGHASWRRHEACSDLGQTAMSTSTRLVALSILVLATGCTPAERPTTPDFVGIWKGTYQDKPLSIELRKDGRMIMLGSAEDEIGLAGYSIDLQQQPAHLDF